MTTDYTDGRRDTHRITLSPVNINKSIVILSAKGYTVNFSSNRLDIAVDSYAVDNGTSMYIYHYYHYVSWQVIEFV